MKETYDETALRTDDGPNVAALVDELTSACSNAQQIYIDMQRAENTRYCHWEGQREDGRKGELVDNLPAKPWPNASDTRQRLADELIVADVRLMKKVSRSAKLTVRGTEGGDMVAAGKVQIYLDHLRGTRMRANIKAQTELAAQWRQTYGVSVMAVTWCQKWARFFDTLTLEQLQQLAASNQLPAAQTFLQFVTSPNRRDLRDAVRLLRQMYPDLDDATAYREIQALKTTGKMSMPNRKLAVNRAEWTALKWMRDIFGPINLSDEQRSPWLAWRVTLTAAELEAKALDEGWSDEFIEAVEKTCGKTILDTVPRGSTAQRRTVFLDQSEEMEGLHEVFYFYYEASDETTGLPCKYRTVISPHIPKATGKEDPLFGFDGPMGYDHALYPFVFHRRERPDRLAADSRGTPTIVHTNQLEVKWQRDGRINQTDLALQPPVARPEREIGLPLNIRPLGEIGQRRQAALSFMTVPPVPPASAPLEAEARRDAQRYFGRNRAEDPVGAGLADQDLADDWAGELEELWSLTLKTAQQFETQLEFNRTVGSNRVPFTVGREEIQGAHDIQVYFNTETMDPERLKGKAQIAQTILLPLDRSGTIDWAPVVAGLFGYYFPEFSDSAIRSQEQASTAELKDEANNWGLILSGTEPDMPEHGVNFTLRLQWLQNKMKEPGAQARLAQLPDSAQLAQRRAEYLQFQIQQQQVNAQTGRVGVAPQQGASASQV